LLALAWVAGAAVPVGGAPSTEGPFFSTEVYTTSTNCSNTAALRAAVDLLDDEWRAVAQADSYISGSLPGPADPTPNPTSMVFGPITLGISKHDIDGPTALSNAAASWGAVDAASVNDPETAVSATLQDCALRPASLYAPSAADRPPFWNATAGDGATRDAVFMEFSEPVAAFGAWFGDLETRQDDGTAGRLKLFDATGAVIVNDPIVSGRPIPLPGDPSGRTTCGGTQAADALACGNQATRYIGFAYDEPTVAAMLVVVGDDDSCAEYPTSCSGNTEHVSLIGPQLAVYDAGELIVEKTEIGGPATEPWRFEVTADNDCQLPETPYRREITAGGGTATFGDLPVTLDGSTPCRYTVTESPTANWAIDSADSSPMSDLGVSATGPLTITVVNRFTPSPTTQPSTSSPTTGLPTTEQTSTQPSTAPSPTLSPTSLSPNSQSPTTGANPVTQAPSSNEQQLDTLPVTGGDPWLVVLVGSALVGAGTFLAARPGRRPARQR